MTSGWVSRMRPVALVLLLLPFAAAPTRAAADLPFSDGFESGGICPVWGYGGDLDCDAVADGVDNCPVVANVDQADSDADGKGDVCDPCPNDSNPGSQPCPVSIYAIKDGTVPVGSTVALRSRLVTGRNSSYFVLQTTPSDPDYVGADNSGIWAFQTGNTVAVGDRIDVPSATVVNFFGQIQLGSPATSVLSSGNSAPATVAVLPSEVATGGTRATALDGVLVAVSSVAVTALDLPANEYVVDNAVRVDDLFYLTSPFPGIGSPYSSITGILTFRNSDSKIEPRGAADVVPASSLTSALATAIPGRP